MNYHKRVNTVIVLSEEEANASRAALRYVLLKIQEELDKDNSNIGDAGSAFVQSTLLKYRSALNSLMIPMVND